MRCIHQKYIVNIYTKEAKLTPAMHRSKCKVGTTLHRDRIKSPISRLGSRFMGQNVFELKHSWRRNTGLNRSTVSAERIAAQSLDLRARGGGRRT
jgi:hypothetical protein